MAPRRQNVGSKCFPQMAQAEFNREIPHDHISNREELLFTST